jgi:hypothetical protein
MAKMLYIARRVAMLRELVDLTGLSARVTAALADTYQTPWTHAPGAVFADLAATVDDGGDCADGVGQRCGDREHVFGSAASMTRCGGWSACGSIPPTCPVSGPPVRMLDQRRALQDPPVANARGELVRVEVDVLVWSRITVVSGRLGTTVTSAMQPISDPHRESRRYPPIWGLRSLTRIR